MQSETKAKWVASLAQLQEQKTELLNIQGESQMQSAALNSAESSLAEASKRYKQAVHEQQTSAQAVQDATEKKEALTTQLAAHKAAHVLA